MARMPSSPRLPGSARKKSIGPTSVVSSATCFCSSLTTPPPLTLLRAFPCCKREGGRGRGCQVKHRGDVRSTPGLSCCAGESGTLRTQALRKRVRAGKRSGSSKRRLTFWFASCSFKFLISISISSTSLAARRSFSRLVWVTCALSLLCARADVSVLLGDEPRRRRTVDPSRLRHDDSSLARVG